MYQKIPWKKFPVNGRRHHIPGTLSQDSIARPVPASWLILKSEQDFAGGAGSNSKSSKGVKEKSD